jgi:hypothetical protein
MSFEVVTAIERAGESTWSAVVPDGWQQGKGAFGGVVIGMLARAMSAAESERRLRSLSADLCAPAMPGPVRIEVATLRRGGSMTFLEARILQDDAVVARASASFAEARNVAPAGITTEPIAIPRWDDAPLFAPEHGGPVFARHYEFRPSGPFPFAGSSEPRTGGFIRPKELPTAYDAPAVCALLDAWWPTAYTLAAMPRGVATVGYTMQLLTDPKSIPVSAPLYYSARGVEQDDNFFVEMRELWSGERRIAMNQQTFVLLYVGYGHEPSLFRSRRYRSRRRRT